MFNKKGQSDLIGNILTTIPKPIIFLFFILILSFIVFLLSPVFNAFGIYCDSSGEVVQVAQIGVFGNIRLMNSFPSYEVESGEVVDANTWAIPCSRLINGSWKLATTGQCNYCDGTIEEQGGLLTGIPYYCTGNVYNWDDPDENMTWWERVAYCPYENCDIPDGYYFNTSTEGYNCISDCSSIGIVSDRDDLLAKVGAKDLYLDDDNDFIKFVCSQELRVKPTIKGIPIFDLSFWFIGILIILMVWGIVKFAKK